MVALAGRTAVTLIVPTDGFRGYCSGLLDGEHHDAVSAIHGRKRKRAINAAMALLFVLGGVYDRVYFASSMSAEG